MKKILPIALLSFVVFIAAAWCVGWFLQAQQIKDQVTAAMNSLDPAMGTLTADSVTTSGFPTHMSVTLTNPGATLHLKQALTQFYKRSMAAAGNSAGVLATPEYPESAYEYKLAGTVTLTINAMSDHLQVSYQGKDSMRMVSPDNTLAMSNEYDGPVKCEMRLQRDAASMFSRLWSLEKFFTQEEFGKQFREAGCQLPGSMTSDTTSNQLLFSLAPSSFSVHSTPVPERTKITLNLHIKDSEVLPAGDEAYAKIMKMF